MHEEHIPSIIEARKAGLSPAGIATKLGLRAADVKRLIKEHGRALHEDARGPFADEKDDVSGLPRLLDCLVLENWQDTGLTAVVLRRQSIVGYGIVTAILVDVWCLGVKNAMGPREMSRSQFERTLAGLFPDESRAIQVSLPLAREIVFGAIAYARGLGFEPHADFAKAALQLGEHTGPISLAFGHKGKPYFLAGPDDDVGMVLSKLRKAVGTGNFDYLVPLGPGFL